MTITTTCPSCSAKYKLADEMVGKKVTCKKCSNKFTITPDDEAETIVPESRSRSIANSDADDDVDQPRKKKRKDDVDDDQGDTGDDAPKKKKGGSKTLYIVLGVVGFFGLICCGCGGFFGWQAYNGAKKGLEALDPGKNAPSINVTLLPDGSYTHNGAIALQDPVDITGKRFKQYALTMEQGKTYTIEMNSKELDSYLVIVNPLGLPIARDDDSGGGLNAKIVFTAPQAGNYRIQAMALSTQNPNANYFLKIRRQ